MHKKFLLSAVMVLGFAGSAGADVLVVPEQPQASYRELPSRGTSQAEVQRRFGEPAKRHAPVGGGNPQQPPITRWDYDGWSVFFENNLVIDAVVPDAPAQVHRAEELEGYREGG